MAELSSTLGKIANPAPLGLMGFGMTTILLNLHNAGFFALGSMILAIGMFYGGLAQVIVGMMEWKLATPSVWWPSLPTGCSGSLWSRC